MRRMPDVINMHFIDRCNYKCFMCFVDRRKDKGLTKDQAFRVVDNIKHYFLEASIARGRINLVGGEPLLSDYIDELIEYIADQGIDVSIVTNGSRLTKSFILKHRHRIKTIGISIDSFKRKTNLTIGRCEGNITPSTNHIIDICTFIKEQGIVLKVNICVSKHNVNENFARHMKRIGPDRLKILQMVLRETINDEAACDVVSERTFQRFVQHLKRFNPIIEDSDDIDNSYVIIDSQANLIKTGNEKQHVLGNVLENDLFQLIGKLELDMDKFARRYTNEE
jgi:radical S-adenosyl methionine domain-containing protein 2